MSDQRMGTCTVCLTAGHPAASARTAARRPGVVAQTTAGPPELVLRPARRPVTSWNGPSAGARRELASGGGRRGPSSVAGELAVGGPVRTGGLGAEALDLVLLVVGEVALEPEPL